MTSALVYASWQPSGLQGCRAQVSGVSISAPASLAAGGAILIENECRDSILSVQVAYPVDRKDKPHSRHASTPSFIVLPPHIPLNAIGIKITDYSKKGNYIDVSQHTLGLVGPEIIRLTSQSDAARYSQQRLQRHCVCLCLCLADILVLWVVLWVGREVG